ncbi:DUF6541 family protein [Rothia koreensis]|uniref:DUF6541 family protein n=1 Tax=Rothia koreensis TaxID=592378 RepID=UPI003F283958
MDWYPILPPVLVGIAAVVVPGFLVGLALKLPVRFCLANAPIFSVGSMTVASVVSGWMGFRWGFLSFTSITLVVTVVLWGASWCWARGRDGRLGEGASGSVVMAGVLGVGVAALMIIGQIKKSILHPDAVSQSYDNIFHLNAIRWIADTGDGSSLSLGAMTTSGGSGAFYPAGWHDFVYLIYSVFPSSIPVATNAATLVIAGFVWPLSVFSLALALRPRDRVFVFSAVGFSGVVVVFPSLLLKWGILYPNLLGYAILPAFLAMLIAAVDMVVQQRWSGWWPVVPSLIIGGSAVTLSHPNALTSAAVLVVPLVLIELVRCFTGKYEGPRRVSCALLVLATLMCIAMWWKVRPAPETSTWEPKYSQIDAFGQFVSNGFNRIPAAWGMSILVFVGIYWALRSRRHRWIVGSWIILCWLWVVVASEPAGAFRLLMVGPWYADEIRLAALTAVPAVVLAGLGMSHVIHKGAAALSDLCGARKNMVRISSAVGLVLLSFSPILLGKFGPVDEAVASTAHEFKVTPDSILITTDEKNVLDQIDRLVPKSDTIVVNPWEGSAVAYALDDRKVTSRHSLSQPPRKFEAILQHLNQARSDPKVCQEVRDQGARWYLDFEDTLNIGAGSKGLYRGLEGVEHEGVVDPVYTSGPVGLYRISACD